LPLTVAQVEDAIMRAAGAWGGVQQRALMKGRGFTVNGRLFALLVEAGLLVKLPPGGNELPETQTGVPGLAALVSGDGWVALPPRSWVDEGTVVAAVRAACDHTRAAVPTAPRDATPRRFRKRHY